MGRGRQKAKHTKVARELKYFSPETNYGALERELSAGQHSDEDSYVDRWADQYGEEPGDDEDEFEPQQDQNKSA
ncbi:DUF3073 domain-containing protein [Curtobacterium sp. MCSS17_007]|jgi:hypothetical protein|uniref:DUF3073 domain-containing protein n=1 Tax=Curtobacterium sp. MCSS17_007 TaxID=2175646 RepID=UPI000DA7D18C|nr:DUF3073 domain-containing protein [Curtobacterium sp. MCSS17_007]WIE76188.1 DUF3073 domain-containing protein [Curtobacterium sp. MCSS17_007]